MNYYYVRGKCVYFLLLLTNNPFGSSAENIISTPDHSLISVMTSSVFDLFFSLETDAHSSTHLSFKYWMKRKRYRKIDKNCIFWAISQKCELSSKTNIQLIYSEQFRKGHVVNVEHEWRLPNYCQTMLPYHTLSVVYSYLCMLYMRQEFGR